MTRSNLRTPILIALGAIVAVFLAAIAYNEYREATIDRLAERIVQDASPAPGAPMTGRRALIRALALRVQQVRRRDERLDLGLAFGCVVITGAMAVFALRAVGRYEALQEEHMRSVQERAQEMERFADRVAHDIRSPLLPVSLALQFAVKRAKDDPKLTGMLERGARSLKHIEELVDALLDFAKAGARPLPGARAEVAPAAQQVLSSLRPLADERRIVLSAEVPEGCAAACAPGVLASLIGNLVGNAIKYMGEAGERRVTVRAAVEGGGVRVQVSDTGPGVPGDVAARIFEPYVRAKGTGQVGLGLGLATVRRLCEGHGGKAGVHSIAGQGSTFWFELPAACTDGDARALE